LSHPDFKKNRSIELNILSKSLESLVKELQEETSSLRLVPFSELFKRLQRLIRDLEKETGKKINFVTEGEDNEIDKMMIEKLYDPLIHIIRNSVDHGIENENERIKKGKTSHGNIKLKTTHRSNEIIITIEDDGVGLNKQKIISQALKLGLLEEGVIPDNNTIFNYIFHPGFSTADKLSNISGRGVGMDVVKHNISDLRGKINIESTEEKGTKIIIHLPLTLAFIEGMIVKSQDKLFAIPIVSISEVFKIGKDKIKHISASLKKIIEIRNTIIPVCYLDSFYNLTKDITVDEEDKIVVIINNAEGKVAIIVDKLIGNQQITLKPLTGFLKDIKAGAGCGILNSGEVVIVLDCERVYAN
ncbi:MAG: chemotaxis protein CheA, partial [Candidatus Sericytochromatia bacterium]